MIAAFAGRQHGVVARRQLLEAGVTRPMVERRMASGRLLPLHQGVYAVGHARLSRDGHRVAALLAAGPGAALSHREAAALHALLPAAGARIELTAPAQRRIAGVTVHRARLDATDVVRVAGMPATSVARTLVDLAAAVPPAWLRRALDEAERSNRLDVAAIDAVLRRTRGRKADGRRALRAALADLAAVGAAVTRSHLEDRFLELLDTHRLPRPTTNAWTKRMEVDACWPRARLVVELDGWDGHRTRRAFQEDRTRSNDLQAAGWTVLRFTYADVTRRPDDTAARVRRALAQAAVATG